MCVVGATSINSEGGFEALSSKTSKWRRCSADFRPLNTNLIILDERRIIGFLAPVRRVRIERARLFR